MLKLVFSAVFRAAERWRALKVTGIERCQMDALRRELDQNCEKENSLNRKPSADLHQIIVSSIIQTRPFTYS